MPSQTTPSLNLHGLDGIGTLLQPFTGMASLQRMNSNVAMKKDAGLASAGSGTSSPSPSTPLGGNSSPLASSTIRGFSRIPAMTPPVLERPGSATNSNHDLSPTRGETSPSRPSPGMNTIRGAIPPPPILDATASVRGKGNIALPPPPPPDNLSTFLATGTVRGRPAATSSKGAYHKSAVFYYLSSTMQNLTKIMYLQRTLVPVQEAWLI